MKNEVFCRLCSRPVFLYANLNYAIIKNNSDLLDDFYALFEQIQGENEQETDFGIAIAVVGVGAGAQRMHTGIVVEPISGNGHDA